ncbi:hypothetical protein D5086_026296 [Populus alba]|uniref:Uncharacterized protein n=1 Tax=Populus alba TaxID=43335 RepID=A0ACC4B352_POPAL
MDAKLRNPETPESISEEEKQQLAIVSSSPFATASLSLSLSTILPTHFLTRPQISALFSYPPTKAKIPTQATSLTHLSLFSSTSSPKLSFKSTISANPLQTPLTLGPRRPSDPSNAAGTRRACIVWFRNDLRVHDNECLNSANNDSMSVLPVYCFDPRDYGKSSSGFDKTGRYRANFLIESVSDLRKNLQARGSDLVVRVGRPETVLVELAKAIGADAVYAHKEVSHDEVKAEDKIEEVMKDEGVEDGKATANASMVGGEAEALQRLQKFAAECQAQPPKGTNGSHDSIYGANFSCKISPWLTAGCISPRSMFDELKKTATRTISGASNRGGGGGCSPDTGMNWLMFELLWRDFFRFITKKYSAPRKQLEAIPATACTTGAFA